MQFADSLTPSRGHVTQPRQPRIVGWAEARFGPKAHHLGLGRRASEMVGQRTEAVLGDSAHPLHAHRGGLWIMLYGNLRWSWPRRSNCLGARHAIDLCHVWGAWRDDNRAFRALGPT